MRTQRPRAGHGRGGPGKTANANVHLNADTLSQSVCASVNWIEPWIRSWPNPNFLGHPTVTGTSVMVSLPKISITFTARV